VALVDDRLTAAEVAVDLRVDVLAGAAGEQAALLGRVDVEAAARLATVALLREELVDGRGHRDPVREGRREGLADLGADVDADLVEQGDRADGPADHAGAAVDGLDAVTGLDHL